MFFKTLTEICFFENIWTVKYRHKLKQNTNKKGIKEMNHNETLEVARIRQEYTEKENQKLDKLRALDRKVKLPAEIFAYSFGTVGSLVLGTGMCLAMGVIGNGLMIPGIVIGCLGIAAVSVNYFIRNKILASRKKKYAEQIMALSDEILNA